MASSKKMLKDANVRVVRKCISSMSPPTLEEIKQIYPPESEITVTKAKAFLTETAYEHRGRKITYKVYAPTSYHKMSNDCQLGSWKKSMAKENEKYYYEWRGQHLLESDAPLSIEFLDALDAAKEKELNKGKEARRTRIKTPLDVVRVTLIDLGYDPSMQDGALRQHVVGACHIQFRVVEPYDVIVSFGYYNGGSGSPVRAEIDRLNIADPQFKVKIESIMKRASNIIDIIAGRA